MTDETPQKLQQAGAASFDKVGRANQSEGEIMASAGKFRKKPVVIEAMQFTEESKNRVFNWVSCNHYADWNAKDQSTLRIETLEGNMTAEIGDWIIKGVKGEFYPCKPDIFAQTYDALASQTPTPVGPTSETGSIPAGAIPAVSYPRPCGLCPGQIESEADLDWHGLGNCVPICERCHGSGQEPEGFIKPDEEKELAKLEARGVKWTNGESAALAKNDAAPTVCPAGPVVEGELRAREALLEIMGVLADPVKWEEDVSQKRFERLTKIGLIARAALTNDPPPSEQSGGQHHD